MADKADCGPSAAGMMAGSIMNAQQNIEAAREFAKPMGGMGPGLMEPPGRMGPGAEFMMGPQVLAGVAVYSSSLTQSF
jgi:hypothetical protein